MTTKFIDKKNVLLIIGVSALLLIIGILLPYLQYQNRVKGAALVQPTFRSSTSHVVHVEYTNKGFIPKSISIKANTTVIWTNTADTLMWVASDPHPSHTNLSGFDQQGIESNSTPEQHTEFVTKTEAHSKQSFYQYTFTKRGQWGYHNHLFPSQKGRVVVQ